ncbi:MAG: Gfo/Idh/MocA family oxidoreductase [Kiritimatiellaeota bacterium]|nr:Gfo/Idh/MocA family oxidoreductase [Kiritimatiellota bacterium]
MQNGKKLIRWGIIGCGAVTEIKSGPAFQRVPGSQLALVMRRTPELAADYAQRHGVERWTSDALEVIRDPGVDAVYIATPPGSHAEFASQVAAAGKPAYIEKPLARCAAESECIIAAFRKAGQPLFVAYYRRALPYFLEAKSLLDSGVIGKVTGINIYFRSNGCLNVDAANLSWRLITRESGGGLFMDLACHTLDIVDFMLGPLEDVSGSATRRPDAPYAVEDHVEMRFRIGAAQGVGAWDFCSPVREDEIVIRGERGSLRLATFNSPLLTLETADGIQKIERPHPATIQEPLITTIVNELLGHGKCPSTGDSALRTARVMDTVLAGFYQGRADRFWVCAPRRP